MTGIATGDPAGVVPFACGTFANRPTTGRSTVKFALPETTVPRASTTVRVTSSEPGDPGVNVTLGIASEVTTPAYSVPRGSVVFHQ